MVRQINLMKKEENIFIMQKIQYLPLLGTPPDRPEPNPILRRRNFSLSTNQESNYFYEKGEFHTQERCDFIYASRKNQILIKKARFKTRDFTKLCQDNLAEYFSLKNKVTDLYATPVGLGKRQHELKDKKYKLSIQLFSPMNVSTRRSQQTSKYRPRTESQSHENEEQTTTLGSISKKYSQMSLKEIVDGGENFQLLSRGKQFKTKTSQSKKRSRKESQDYQINGW